MSKSTDKSFKSYGNHTLSVIGTFKTEVNAGPIKSMAEFFVVKESGKTMIGFETGKNLAYYGSVSKKLVKSKAL